MHEDKHPGPGLPVDVDGNGLAVPPGDQLLHSAGVYVGWLRSVRTGRGARTLAAPVAVGMLHDSQYARRDEPRGADHSARPRHLANLDCGAGAADLDGPARLGRLDDVFTCGARTGVHQDLDKITFGHALFMPKFASFHALLRPLPDPPPLARGRGKLVP